MMDIDSPANSTQTYTILKIKRKRIEEPLDALVVDANTRARRRKTRRGFDVFQFAETVEPEALEDENQKRDLQERISALARTRSSKEKPDEPVERPQPPVPTSPEAPLVGPQSPLNADEPTRRYTVINPPVEHTPPRRVPLTAPPKVISHKELTKPKPDFTYYDAVLASERQAKDDDKEVNDFVPLLEEYLKLSDISHPSSFSSLGRSSEDDYVWDIFYHRPATVDEWNKLAANVGTLTGFPASFGHPNDSDSDSEVKDDEDEDSNAEDYYTNDYPDEGEWEESDDSDMFHEQSDHEDLFSNDDNDSDDEWMNSAMRGRY